MTSRWASSARAWGWIFPSRWFRAARQRFSRALAAAGPGLSDLAYEVCCDLVSLETAEARRGRSRRSARVVLMLALDRLAAHYGMTVDNRRAPIRAWSAEN